MGKSRIIFVLFYDVHTENMFTTNLEDGREAPSKASIWMICLELNWFVYDPSGMLQLSEFAWTLRSSVWLILNHFLLIDATDRSKISSDQKRFFIALSHTPFHFSRTLLLKAKSRVSFFRNKIYFQPILIFEGMMSLTEHLRLLSFRYQSFLGDTIDK